MANPPGDRPRHIKCLQVNLHHVKAASDVLCRRFKTELLDVAFIQEPWVFAGAIKGLNDCDELTQQDLAAVWTKVPTQMGEQEVVLASAYLPGDSCEMPTREVIALEEYCRRRKLKLVMSCDANAHHCVWGSSDTNSRGESFLEFITRNNLFILNRGNEPTFVNAIRGEVLDLTISSTSLSTFFSNWHVSNEVSMSDHRHIRFDIEAQRVTNLVYRNPRKTNWELFRLHIEREVNGSTAPISSVYELEDEARKFQDVLKQGFEESCPLRTKKSQRDVPWWSDSLGKLRKRARKLFNRAKSTGDWTAYKSALTAYNCELRRSKRATWREHCGSISSLPEVHRLQKALKLDHLKVLCTLKRPDVLNEFYDATQFIKPIDHKYKTRRREEGRFQVPKFRNEYSKHSLSVTMPTLLNELPANNLNLPKTPQGKTLINNHYLNSL
ncbi:uncharacterized protein LOC118738204 [Rhagoletis pomonella]|uniref:uncharacterized protein LOC118738204 n=1 Tax=Rhagoletis pomonella TaxID=28610 RepID=UPI00178087BC|nr:uncharacterized protein LOC118738204 [Rhagoletis pomonella]